MTPRNRVGVEIKDIRTVRLTCRNDKCGATYSFRLVGTPRIPARCPNCDSQWYGVPSAEEQQLAELVRLLEAVADGTRLGFLLEFEVDAP